MTNTSLQKETNIMKLGKKEDLAIAALYIVFLVALIHILGWVVATREGMGAIAVLVEAAVFLLGFLALLIMGPILSWYENYKYRNNNQAE